MSKIETASFYTDYSGPHADWTEEILLILRGLQIVLKNQEEMKNQSPFGLEKIGHQLQFLNAKIQHLTDQREKWQRESLSTLQQIHGLSGRLTWEVRTGWFLTGMMSGSVAIFLLEIAQPTLLSALWQIGSILRKVPAP